MMIKCEFCGKEYTSKGIGTHMWRTHGDGKDHKVGGSKKGRIAWNKGLDKSDPRVALAAKKVSNSMKGMPGRAHTQEDKNRISESMKKAHIEGRAWNIGKSRWNNQPSYPETFFMQVIENEFNNKCYVREHSVGLFSLDFAWVEKKRCIEIDGEQHKRFQEYQERDQRKDLFLESNGWQILRIEWKQMFSNPKHWIQIAKKFIDC